MATTEDLLQSMNGKLDDMRDWQTRQSVVCEARGLMLERHGVILQGNGRPGLETRVDRIETYAKAASTSVKVAWSIITVAIAAVSMMIGHLLGR